MLIGNAWRRRIAPVRRVAAWALVLCVLCALPGEVRGAEPDAPQGPAPLLTLLFTGNTEGQFRPCEVCGGTAHGGLDRRSTVLAQVRAQGGGRVLALAGGYEFTPFRAEPPGADVARALALAYAHMGYDLGLLSARDFDWLRGAGANPGPAWLPPAPEPRVRRLDAGGLRVGVVVLPAGQGLHAPAAPEAVEAVLHAARELRPEVDLLVGLGAWGWQADKALLEAPGLPLDVLLSSGAGHGTGVRPVAGGRVLEVRPEYQGWSVIRLDILALPQAGPDAAWTEGVHYRARVLKLDATVPGDAKVSSILGWM